MDESQSIPQSEELIHLAWPTSQGALDLGFFENWFLRVTSPDQNLAFWLRFNLLNSKNGFRRMAETWAMVCQKNSSEEIESSVLKKTFEITKFSKFNEGPLRLGIGDCFLNLNRSQGELHSKGKDLKWKLEFEVEPKDRFSFIPKSILNLGILKNRFESIYPRVKVIGSIELNGKKFEIQDGLGAIGHFHGNQSGYTWTWTQCDRFIDEKGSPVSAALDGLSIQRRLFGQIKTPRITSLLIRYLGKEYHFNSLWDSVRTRSQHSMTEWMFEVESADLLFQGKIRALHHHFVGLNYEDLDGRNLFSAHSEFSDVVLVVYRNGKLENRLNSNNLASLEVVTSERNPYVPISK